MKYDKEIQTQYGFIHGSKTLVFIKTGRGMDIRINMCGFPTR